MDLVVGLAFEGLELARADLQLVHVLAEVAHVVAHRGRETFARIREALDALTQAAEERVEGVELDRVEQLFLARHVVVEPRETGLGFGGDAPHGGLVVADRTEDPSRGRQYVQPLALEGGGPPGRGLEGWHRSSFERSFEDVQGHARPDSARYQEG